ncbi:hypothetical protein CsSME_00005171 [Camellia sinensis var. sinensis]
MSAEFSSIISRSQVDLLDFVDWSGIECLNQSTTQSIANALMYGDFIFLFTTIIHSSKIKILIEF